MKEQWNFYVVDLETNQKNGYFNRFLKKNPEFNTDEFKAFVISENKADRDSGELESISKHEILRLAYEFVEHKHRFPNCHAEDEIWNDQDLQ
ncbi:MAG: hypothetical protein KJI69_05765 [Patescibacteria group bacterium]|nr:hypothetical protein [Patescibacteria group bacterium]